MVLTEGEQAIVRELRIIKKILKRDVAGDFSEEIPPV